MLIIVHNSTTVTSVLNENLEQASLSFENHKPILNSILDIAKQLEKSELLIWCHQDVLRHLNVSEIASVFHHKHILATYSSSKTSYLSERIDYLERSICLKFDCSKRYGTYKMSSQVGGIFSEVLFQFESFFSYNNLNSLAKTYLTEGLFCYHEPSLLKQNHPIIKDEEQSNSELFSFAKEHYKWVWSWFLLLSIVIFEKKFLLFPFLKAQFLKQKPVDINLKNSEIKSSKTVAHQKSIDVIIPTIGRKAYLYDVLKDLAKQTFLPKQVIIVEQHGDTNSSSELDYLTTETWPFKINLTFTHQLGVCNARNLALQHLENDWVFFADDDIRFDQLLFESSFNTIEKYGAFALNFSCLQEHQTQTYFNIGQTFIFGSGSSFVSSKIAKQINFDKTFEFGFGEDTDYGANIRALGYDVVFAANINLLHLKAPMGGFRQPIPKLWDNDPIKPKPAPTMLALFQKHFIPNQLKGYKLFLFLKMYGKSNPFNYYSNLKKFQKRWNKSLFYANKLSKINHA
jgi:glycosyltransferase involved in cell wall biosynthesis